MPETTGLIGEPLPNPLGARGPGLKRQQLVSHWLLRKLFPSDSCTFTRYLHLDKFTGTPPVVIQVC